MSCDWLELWELRNLPLKCKCLRLLIWIFCWKTLCSATTWNEGRWSSVLSFAVSNCPAFIRKETSQFAKATEFLLEGQILYWTSNKLYSALLILRYFHTDKIVFLKVDYIILRHINLMDGSRAWILVLWDIELQQCCLRRGILALHNTQEFLFPVSVPEDKIRSDDYFSKGGSSLCSLFSH